MTKLLTQRYDQQDGLCIWCGRKMWLCGRETIAQFAVLNEFSQNEVRKRLRATQEHIIPRSLGGELGENIVAAHAKCNGERSNKTRSKRPNPKVALLLPLEVQEHITKALAPEPEKEIEMVTLDVSDTFLREELDRVHKRLGEAEGRIYDMYLQDDGEAFAEAFKYLKAHRPDLADKADEVFGEKVTEIATKPAPEKDDADWKSNDMKIVASLQFGGMAVTVGYLLEADPRDNSVWLRYGDTYPDFLGAQESKLLRAAMKAAEVEIK